MKRPTLALSATLAIAVALGLGACSSEPTIATNASDGVTLLQTKPAVQLLRNEAIDRIPVASVESVVTTDGSVACLSAAEDPDELMRSWHSGLVATIATGAAFRVNAISANLTQAFTDDGWTAIELANGSMRLESPTVKVQIFLDPESKSDTEATLTVIAKGECVKTAGKDSDEVKDLETPAE